MTKWKRIIIPIHVDGNHWVVAVIDFENQRIDIYDSLGGQRGQELQVRISY